MGGLIMIDNILLGGRVVDRQNQKDISNNILIMDKFNAGLPHDKRISPIALPMGDGTLLLRKETD